MYYVETSLGPLSDITRLHDRIMPNQICCMLIFGQCDDASVELVKKIARMPRDGNDRPNDPPKIVKITILHAGGTHASPAHKAATKPATKTTKPQ